VVIVGAKGAIGTVAARIDVATEWIDSPIRLEAVTWK
jgi:hypothetical protein